MSGKYSRKSRLVQSDSQAFHSAQTVWWLYIPFWGQGLRMVTKENLQTSLQKIQKAGSV
jgi:hypothetical protein